MKILYWAIVPLFCVVVGSVLSSPRTGKQQESVVASPSPSLSISPSPSPSPSPSVKPSLILLTEEQVTKACVRGLMSRASGVATAEGRLLSDDVKLYDQLMGTKSSWLNNFAMYTPMARHAIFLKGGYDRAYGLTEGVLQGECAAIYSQAREEFFSNLTELRDRIEVLSKESN